LVVVDMDLHGVTAALQQCMVEGVGVSLRLRICPYFNEFVVDGNKAVTCGCPLEKDKVFETVQVESYEIFCSVPYRKNIVLPIGKLPLSVDIVGSFFKRDLICQGNRPLNVGFRGLTRV